MKRAICILSLVPLLVCSGQNVAPNAPKDKPVSATEKELAVLDKAIAPYVAKARATYPEAKKRYLAGLPAKHTFFLTARLRDKDGNFEQVFIAVDKIKDGNVTGRIWSDLNKVKGFKRGDSYTFAEKDMFDWLITKPDGSEEGNFVGNFLDTYKP